MRQYESPAVTNGCILNPRHQTSQTMNGNDESLETKCKRPTVESNLPPMPAGLEPLRSQLGGHKFGHKDNDSLYGILDCKDGTILKPVVLHSRKGQRERYFYALVNGCSTANQYFDDKLYDVETLRKLKKFTPTFKGFVSLNEHPNVLYIKMVDISHVFVKPHLIDVKMGAEAWELSATEEKKQRQINRCPHLNEICFQVVGAKYYDGQTGEPVVKENIRRLAPHDLLYTGLYDIFVGLPECARSVILQHILEDLQEIADWFSSQSRLLFRGSSILIVFEGDTVSLSSVLDKTTGRGLLQVKLIDFVHVWEKMAIDQNYLKGITNLIKYLTSLSAIFSQSTIPLK